MTDELLAWYRKSKRDLPWRKLISPYAVLVSEMMLQQTRVDTVIAYYNAFMLRFPDVFALANAREADVLHAWQGLGYYNRARNLHKLSKQVAQNGGKFPTAYNDWLKLPGVGPYIAGAVMSIAQGTAQPAVDGNVLRVLSRIDGSKDDIALPATRKAIQARVQALMPPYATSDFTQALMELGALVCKPTAPLCAECPVQSHCHAYQNNAVAQIPYKSPKRKPKEIPLWAVLATCKDEILLLQRDDTGLLANMWGVPIFERSGSAVPVETIEQTLDLSLNQLRETGRVTHVFTHRRWEMIVLHAVVSSHSDASAPLEWMPLRALKTKAIPTAFKKVLKLLDDAF